MNLGRFMYWPPWSITQQWGNNIFLGGDEWHNSSLVVVLPFLGAFIFFYGRGFTRLGPEHLHSFSQDVYEGAYYPSCKVCREIMKEHYED